jgi:hypothetical protein
VILKITRVISRFFLSLLNLVFLKGIFKKLKEKEKKKKNIFSLNIYNMVDSGQRKDKNDYYHSLKTRQGGRLMLKQGPESWIGLTINPGQHKNKNSCYYNFKTLLRGRFRVRPRSWVGLISDSGQCKGKNNYYHNFKT